VRVAAALVALLVLLGSRAPALAQSLALPVVVQKDGLVVRAEAGLDKLARKVAAKAPDQLAAIRADLEDLPVPERIEIRLVKKNSDIPRAAPQGYGAPRWAAGVAYPSAGVVVVATRRESSSINVTNVVAHELAHMALGAALRGRAPRWLDEGFAYLHSSDWSFARSRTLTGMAWTGDVIPLSEIDRRFPAQEAEASRAYAESYDLVAYLAKRGTSPEHYDDGDRWPFRHFLARIAAGDDLDVAARKAYRARLDELFGEWYQSLRNRYLLMPVGLIALGIWVIGAIILVLAYLRKRRLSRAKMDEWEEEDRARDAARAALLEEGEDDDWDDEPDWREAEGP
jgi:hypothetical protein